MNPSTAVRSFLDYVGASRLFTLLGEVSSKLPGATKPAEPLPGQAPVRMDPEPLPSHIEPIEDET
jgi:hypothetical protein